MSSEVSNRFGVQETSTALPRFTKPPVVEVAISVEFEELQGFDLVDFGLFWERVRDRYPRAEHRDPVPSVIERFGGRPYRAAELRIEARLPLGRAWYLRDDGHRLLQLQPDRFVLNWRRATEDAEYPSYDTLRTEFHRELREFVEFVTERRLGSFEPTQCEVTYVNHFLADREGNTASELPRVLRAWLGTAASAYLPEIEDARFAWQYRFDEGDAPLGRLHVVLNSAERNTDKQPVLVLQLIARGAPRGSDIESVLAFTDRAHEWIVRGFTEITTQQMHIIWERES